MKANHFEPALRPNHKRSVADPAVNRLIQQDNGNFT